MASEGQLSGRSENYEGRSGNEWNLEFDDL